MRNSTSLLLTVSTLALAACNPFHRDPVTEVTRDVNLNTRWSATLVTPTSLAGAVQMKGSATMQPGENSGITEFALRIDNATPGGRHPWQVHRGQCGADEGLVGAANAFGTVNIDDDGRGKASGSIRMTTPTLGNYFVTVSASPTNSEMVLACGNLAPPAM